MYITVLSDWLQATAVSAGRAEHVPVVQGWQVALVRPPGEGAAGSPGGWPDSHLVCWRVATPGGTRQMK